MATISGTHDFIRYNAIARLFHAGIAALVLFNILTGILGEAIEDIWQPFPAHKATGILILFLSLARLGWRFTWTMPAWPATMGKLQQNVARLTHGALYVLMIVVPLTGWIFSSAGKYPLSIYGLFDWPKLPVAKGSALAEAAHEGHEVLGFLMAGLVVLHIAAALHHHFIIKDNVLRRML
ncbi:MAG: cytochrome b [Novosphingobium sp.]|nr:cytochrome b [Novosphingobium sp.]